MKIKVKLFAGLKCANQELASYGKNDFELELTADPLTLGDLLNLLEISADTAKIMFVNALSRPVTYFLADGDEVSIFPPVGGG